jgi:tRNA A37 methylthiotransferase MiaB
VVVLLLKKVTTFKNVPYVDMIFGPQTLHRLPQMLDQHQDQVEKPKKKNQIG